MNNLLRIGDQRNTGGTTRIDPISRRRVKVNTGSGTVRTNTLDSRSYVDASIIERLKEAGYVLQLKGEGVTAEPYVNSLGQFVWPSTIGNIPAFRDNSGGIFILSDRKRIYCVVTNVGPDTPNDPTPTDTGGGGVIIDNGGVTPPIDTGGPVTGGPLFPPVDTGGPINPPVDTTPIPPGGIVGSGKIYNRFAVDDVVANQQETITKAMWTNNVSNLLEMHINPNQTTSQKKYYLEVYNTGSTEDCLAEPQFSIAFGNKYGSGSEDQGVQVDDTPTRAIYGQYRLLCLNGSKETFVMNGKSVESIYVININRARFKEWIDEGNLQINLQSLTGYNYDKSANNGFTSDPWLYTGSNIAVEGSESIISLIDDSRINDPELTSAGEVHQIVSGSLENYQTNGGVHLINDAPVVYGLLYKRLGVIVLDAEMLDDNLFFGTVLQNSSGGGEIEGDNPMRLFTSMSGSAIYTDGSGDPLGFQARSAEKVKSTHYFCRVKNAEYNFSNNPTFTTGSDGDLQHPTMINDPKTYITTVGLYNNRKELVAVAKLSKPFQKHFARESVVRVKLEY